MDRIGSAGWQGEPPEPVNHWSNAELVACVTGRRRACILPPWDQGLMGLVTHTEAQLVHDLDLRPAQARRLLAAMEMARRLMAGRLPPRPHCGGPEAVAAIMRPLVLIDHERLWCLPLDPRQGLIGQPMAVAQGDVDGTDAGPRAVCRAALRAGASSMIVVHNHPSGDPSPSTADVAVTRRIAAAGRAVDVSLLDHVVVCANGSFVGLRSAHPECWA